MDKFWRIYHGSNLRSFHGNFGFSDLAMVIILFRLVACTDGSGVIHGVFECSSVSSGWHSRIDFL